MNSRICETYSEEETFSLGRELGRECVPGSVIALLGDLGVGKTVFSKGFGQGLGIGEPIVSPTFTLLQIYEGGRLPLYHFDVYRIADVEELEEIGYEEYVYGDGVCLIEWANRILDILPEACTVITIEKDLQKGVGYRRIAIESREQWRREGGNENFGD